MKKRSGHSLQFNFIMNFLLSASSIIFPLITVPYVSRILLPARTGQVAWAVSVVTYFTMIAMLGVPTYGIKAVANAKRNQEDLNQTVIELLSINLIMTTISYLLFFLALALIPRMQEDRTLLLICSSAILLNSTGVSWFYQGMEEYGYITTASILMKIVAVILMFLMIHSPDDYLWYGVVSVISTYGSNLINFIRLPFYISFKGVKKLAFHVHMKAVLTFFAMSVATTVYTNLDTVMLGFMSGDVQTGYYNEAIKIKVLMTTLITSLGTVLLPRMSSYWKDGNIERFEYLFSKALSFVLLLSIPLALFFSFFAEDIIWILSGEAYLPCVPAMIVLMPTIVLIGVSNLSGIQVLVPMNREMEVLISVSAGAVLDLILNAILIPYLGALGAAIGTLCAETLVLSIQLFYLKDLFKRVFPTVEWKYLMFALTGSAPFLFLSFLTGYVGQIFTFILGGLFYFGVYGLILIKVKEPILTENLRRISRLLKPEANH